MIRLENQMAESTQDRARELLAAVFMVMQAVRVEMRSRRTPDLTVPQFRTLVFLSKFPGAGLSDLAEHIGLSLPSMSKMIDGLVSKGLVTRVECVSDRRRVSLSLTTTGKSIYRQASRGTNAALAKRLDALSPEESANLSQAMRAVERIFTNEREAQAKL
jgi:DNA-binding MarR family transcriptional regulator